MAYAVITSTSASLQATAMASLPVMSEVSSPFAAWGFLNSWWGTIASAMSISPSALAGDLEHVGDLLLVLAAEAEAVGPLGPIGDLLLHPLLVPVVVLPPGVPLSGVVRERRLVHHGDALGLGADGLAYAAAAAGLHVRVVEALGRHVEDGVRTRQPAERALDALVEVHHRPHGARRPLLERRVALGTVAALLPGDRVGHLVAHRDAGDGDAFPHLGPLGHRELVRLLRIALRRLHRVRLQA